MSDLSGPDPRICGSLQPSRAWGDRYLKRYNSAGTNIGPLCGEVDTAFMPLSVGDLELVGFVNGCDGSKLETGVSKNILLIFA
jgi:hypothetical protein